MTHDRCPECDSQKLYAETPCYRQWNYETGPLGGWHANITVDEDDYTNAVCHDCGHEWKITTAELTALAERNAVFDEPSIEEEE